MKTVLAWLFSTSLAFAQLGPGAGVPVGPGASSGGGGGSGGSGTVTSIATGCQATGGTITTTGTISTSETVNLQTGSNYAILSTDCGALVNLSNASAQVPTIAQAGTAGFSAGYFVDICNIGAGTQTLTPATSTIYGVSTFVLSAGNVAPQCARVISDGTNYQVVTPITKVAVTQAQADNSTKIATTAYTDLAVANAIAGVNPAISVSAATTAASDTSGCTYANGASGIGATLTCEVNTAKVIDGFTFNTITTQSLLVKNDTQSPSGAFNGIYNLTALQTGITGAIFTRRLDYDTPSDINNTGAIPVISGTANATTSWLLTTNVVTVGTTALSYTQFSINPTNVVQGPASSTDGHFAIFNSTTGKLLKDTLGAPAASATTDTTNATNISSGALAAVRLGTIFHPGYKSSNWYGPWGVGNPANGAALTASTVYCHVWPVPAQGITLKTLGLNVTTAAVGNVSMALYNNDGTNFRPGTKIDDIGTTGVSTNATPATHAVANTTDVLTGGIYWACMSSDNVNALFASIPAATIGAGNGGALIGSSVLVNAIATGAAQITGVSCTAGTTCQGASFAWSGATFTWPASLSTSTWADIVSARAAVIAFQAN